MALIASSASRILRRMVSKVPEAGAAKTRLIEARTVMGAILNDSR